MLVGLKVNSSLFVREAKTGFNGDQPNSGIADWTLSPPTTESVASRPLPSARWLHHLLKPSA